MVNLQYQIYSKEIDILLSKEMSQNFVFYEYYISIVDGSDHRYLTTKQNTQLNQGH